MNHRIVGMQILAVMVQDINPPSFAKSASKFRKAGKRIPIWPPYYSTQCQSI